MHKLADTLCKNRANHRYSTVGNQKSPIWMNATTPRSKPVWWCHTITRLVLLGWNFAKKVDAKLRKLRANARKWTTQNGYKNARRDQKLRQEYSMGRVRFADCYSEHFRLLGHYHRWRSQWPSARPQKATWRYQLKNRWELNVTLRCQKETGTRMAI